MTEHKALRLIVVEDEDLLRDLLVVSLENISPVRVIGAYADGQTATQHFSQDQPDVALLDINLGPGWTGVETAMRFRTLNPDIGIVLLSNYARPELLSSLPESSLHGWSYLLKRSVRDLSTLTRAIEGAAAGLMVLDPELVKMAQSRRSSHLKDLTPRQSQILALVAQGYTNLAIAKALFLSEKSVENHLTTIYSTLHIESSNPEQHARVKAVLLFLSSDHDSPRWDS